MDRPASLSIVAHTACDEGPNRPQESAFAVTLVRFFSTLPSNLRLSVLTRHQLC